MSKRIEIYLADQILCLSVDDRLLCKYSVSTSAKGVGEREHSQCTPCGRHYIAEKIGADCPPNTVFVARKPTGETYTQMLAKQYPERDWILTRIIWLHGSEWGHNRGGKVDSYRRYIYIHGTPDSVVMGTKGSKGCIRMCNKDIIELFDRTELDMEVMIYEGSYTP